MNSGVPGCSEVLGEDGTYFGNFRLPWLPQCRRPGFDPGLGRSSGEGNGNPLQCSCLENPLDRGACGVRHDYVTSLVTLEMKPFLGDPGNLLSEMFDQGPSRGV